MYIICWYCILSILLVHYCYSQLLQNYSLTMPKAERGTPKDLANRMKSKGLQKLAFYCQACEKQMRDQNGFKQHCASEPHVRMMLVVGDKASRVINDYSRQFKHDFLQLLRTSHGEKKVHANHFYQEYIQNKSHIHMNSTHWKTLTEFVKGLGRDGICRVEEGERGLFVSYIDTSTDALNRQAAIKKREKQDKGDEERANALIAEQIDRANREAADKEVAVEPVLDKKPEEKIKLSFNKSANNVESTGGKKQSIFAQKKVDVGKPVITQKRPLSNAEQMVMEERERKRRQEERSQFREERQRRSVY